MRLAGDIAHERQRGLAIAARRVAKVDLRDRSVIGDHGAEQIGGDSADEASRGAEPRDADRNVEAGAANHRHQRVASVCGFDGEKIDQGISATQEHRPDSFPGNQRPATIPRIASRLSRSSRRIMPWICRFERWKSAIPGAVGALDQPIADIAAIASPTDL